MSNKKDNPTHSEGSVRHTGWNPSKEVELHYGAKTRFTGMSYDNIKAALKPGELFVDEDFDAVDSNIFYSGFKAEPPHEGPYTWKRPKELSKNPKFFVEGATRFDIVQGGVGDCWFLCALGSLSLYPKLFKKIVPDQDFGDGYAGIFHFNFWHDGRWIEVVIDDRLPTNKTTGLIMMHSNRENEFWSALLEKAYAKLYGAYECLHNGQPNEAMVDFTGGVVERYALGEDAPKNLLKIIQQAFDRGSLAACFTNSEEGTSKEFIDPKTCIVKGHAYSITDIKKIDHGKTKVSLLRIRNPWGQIEWQGDWSDKSSIWKSIPEEERKRLGIVNNEEDGEFWMAYSDFLKHFLVIEFCHLIAKMDDGTKSWQKLKRYDSWVAGVNAGGSSKHVDTYWTNPQLRFKVVHSDEDDEVETGTVLVALTQCGAREKRRYKTENREIGYTIYKLDDTHKFGSGHLPKAFFDTHPPVEQSGPSQDEMYLPVQHFCNRHELLPGEYVVVASTSTPNQEMKFLLRLFTEQPITSYD